MLIANRARVGPREMIEKRRKGKSEKEKIEGFEERGLGQAVYCFNCIWV